VQAAFATVRENRVISLALPLDDTGPQVAGRRRNPQLLMLATGSDHVTGGQRSSTGLLVPAQFGIGDDAFSMATQAGTHLDALSHIFWEGQMFNGFPATDVSATGARRCDAASMGAVAGRGVLVDVARSRGVDALAPGEAITSADLDRAMHEQGTDINPGDILLVRTGFLGARRNAWADYSGGSSPGLSLETAAWLHRQCISVLAADTWGVEVRPNEIDMFQPLHVVSLVHSGIPFGENFVLDELAAACAEAGRYEFLLMLPTLALTGACGSPINPLAVL
jgi:kynurenine formamidase